MGTRLKTGAIKHCNPMPSLAYLFNIANIICKSVPRLKRPKNVYSESMSHLAVVQLDRILGSHKTLDVVFVITIKL